MEPPALIQWVRFGPDDGLVEVYLNGPELVALLHEQDEHLAAVLVEGLIEEVPE